nr:MAG TPA: Protocadherin-15, LHFPL tetraspan subfamily member, LHFPL5, protocadherin, tip link [Caudoviricetes sp.]
MELMMCILLGILSMFILLHGSVLLLIAAVVWKRRHKQEASEPEKTEEERRAEEEMKLFNEGVANILSYGTPKERDR